MAEPLPPVIAIDGPSASGKGTIARAVAQTLGFHHLDSGALYRLVALAALKDGVDLEDELQVSDIASNLDAEFSGDRVYLRGQDVTDAIRSEDVGAAASQVAVLPRVRQALIARQRGFRRPPGLVAEGRDMGSVVFPDAVLKIYLTASPEERARRRYKQLMEKGMSANMSSLLQDILERDRRDAGRAVAPLRKCADAVEIDTTSLTIAEVTAQVVRRFREAAWAP
jgi:cytidylate kinase